MTCRSARRWVANSVTAHDRLAAAFSGAERPGWGRLFHHPPPRRRFTGRCAPRRTAERGKRAPSAAGPAVIRLVSALSVAGPVPTVGFRAFSVRSSPLPAVLPEGSVSLQEGPCRPQRRHRCGGRQLYGVTAVRTGALLDGKRCEGRPAHAKLPGRSRLLGTLTPSAQAASELQFFSSSLAVKLARWACWAIQYTSFVWETGVG